MRLDRILDELHEIQRRLDKLENAIRENKPQPIEVSTTKLLSLPDHLRTTFMAVASHGECTASDVALITTRARALESSYLNMLWRMEWLTKHHGSKKVLFRVTEH